ncbi:MAG: hypothetical protein AB1611_19445 [bacterium]
MVGAIAVIGTALTFTTDIAGLKMMVIVAAAFLSMGRGILRGTGSGAKGDGRREGGSEGKGKKDAGV